MALRCTVFGHRWGEAGVEREREEDGNEVVVTVREVRTCGRCGADDVLGESKEVTAIDPSDPDTAEPAREQSDPDPESEDEEAYDAETDDGVILDENGGGERSPREWPDPPQREDARDERGEPAPWPESARPDDEEPPEDRFVGPDETLAGPDGGRTTGHESPTAGDARRTSGHLDADPAGGPDRAVDADADDSRGDRVGEGGDDRTLATGADREDGGRGGRGDGGRGGRGDGDPGDVPRRESDPDQDGNRGRDAPVTPDEPPAMGPDATQRPEDDAEVLESTEPNEQSRASAEEPVDPVDPTVDESPGASEPLDPGQPTDVGEPAPENVEFYCPECGFVDDSEWPSRRAGDVCPNCRRSYLAEES